MKNIYYMSFDNQDLYPENTSFNFTSVVPENSLDDVPEGPLDAAVKVISFNNTRTSRFRYDERIGVRSNLSDKIITSGTWDNIIALLSLGKSASSKRVFVEEFENPSFFPTTKESLRKATFELVDVVRNIYSPLQHLSPTFIHIIVKKQEKRMKQPFYVHLDSKCPISKSFFPENTDSEFTIQLPKRLEFQKDWIVALKNLSMSNSIRNTFNCTITVNGEVKTLSDGVLRGEDEIIQKLNELMGGILSFRLLTLPSLGKVLVRPIKQEDTLVSFSDNLALILGLSDEQKNFNFNTSSRRLISTNKVNINANVPTQFIVGCDVVESSIFGGERRKILRTVINQPTEDSFLNFDFPSNQYLKLENKSFEKLKIWITDVYGNPLLVQENMSTRLQLLFLNTNSY